MSNYRSVCIFIFNYQTFSNTITFVEQIKLQKQLNLKVLIIYNNSAGLEAIQNVTK